MLGKLGLVPGALRAIIALVLSYAVIGPVTAQVQATDAAPAASDGSVQVPATTVPLSGFLSPEARKLILERRSWILRGGLGEPLPGHDKVDIKTLRDRCAERSAAIIARMRQRYAVDITHRKVAGISADVVTPKAPISDQNRNRVLINLHGGGFIGKCADGLVESIPIAAIGNIKVITLDYRQAPEFTYPAASEDVAAAYKALLEEYRPENIGIYGCSAGGRLTGQATAWIIERGLPRPGALGVFCSGLTSNFSGDSAYSSRLIQTQQFSLEHLKTYFAGADLNSPMVSPGFHSDLLAKFPPVLFITGTRDSALSNAAYSHNQLAKAGIESELRVWDGLWHAFLYDDLPEANEAYEMIAKFFDKRLGVAPLNN